MTEDERQELRKVAFKELKDMAMHSHSEISLKAAIELLDRTEEKPTASAGGHVPA